MAREDLLTRTFVELADTHASAAGILLAAPGGDLQTALSSRIIIEQAQGMVAQSLAVNVDQAFAQLRRHDRNQNALLTDVCRGVVDGTLGLEVLERPPAAT